MQQVWKKWPFVSLYKVTAELQKHCNCGHLGYWSKYWFKWRQRNNNEVPCLLSQLQTAIYRHWCHHNWDSVTRKQQEPCQRPKPPWRHFSVYIRNTLLNMTSIWTFEHGSDRFLTSIRHEELVEVLYGEIFILAPPDKQLCSLKKVKWNPEQHI